MWWYWKIRSGEVKCKPGNANMKTVSSLQQNSLGSYDDDGCRCECLIVSISFEILSSV